MSAPTPPFGAIISSRPVLTAPTPISQTACSFTIPSQPSFSHIVVFLLPGQTLPPGTAATVFVQIPPSTEFKLLGALANEKQSAIFKVNIGKNGDVANGAPAAAGQDDIMLDDATLQPEPASSGGGPSIVLGISIEPVASVEQQLAALKDNQAHAHAQPPFGQAGAGGGGMELVRHQAAQQPKVATQVLAQRIIENAFNFLSSFAQGPPGRELVTLKSFHEWWDKFRKRLELDPGFLERELGT